MRQRYHELFADPELPVPVEAIAEDLLGLNVAEAELEVSGLLLPAEREIYVNEAEPAPRRRFTLAHEIGHWICQCLEGNREAEPVYCRTEDVGPDPAARTRERQANVFAAELLMPKLLVEEEWRRTATVPALAGRFGVSTEAIQWRLFNFGLVDEQP